MCAARVLRFVSLHRFPGEIALDVFVLSRRVFSSVLNPRVGSFFSCRTMWNLRPSLGNVVGTTASTPASIRSATTYRDKQARPSPFTTAYLMASEFSKEIP